MTNKKKVIEGQRRKRYDGIRWKISVIMSKWKDVEHYGKWMGNHGKEKRVLGK